MCHDNISDSKAYHTENLLKEKEIPYIHFPKSIQRDEHDSLIKQIACFIKMKQLVKNILETESPDVIVTAVDNDPISYIFLKQAKRLSIKSIIVQEGSVRPNLTRKISGIREFCVEILRIFGIRLSYISHGRSNLYDMYCVAGEIVKDVFVKNGAPAKNIAITGAPKYDNFFKEASKISMKGKDSLTLLFAAGFFIISDEENRTFLKQLTSSVRTLNIKLLIKLHPRSSEKIADIKGIIGKINLSHCDIIKEGDETLNLLKNVYGVITVASTVVTEALIMDREGILVDYLAKGLKLPFGGYDAVHHINSLNEIEPILLNSLKHKKSFENKKNLLEKNLYLLDGKSSDRVATIIQNI